MENLMEVFTPTWRSVRPWLFGEYNDSDTLRDVNEIRAEKKLEKIWWASGDSKENPISLLKPDFFLNQFEDRAEKSGLLRDFSKLKPLSYDHSLTYRKTLIEQTRAFPEISGYDITAIHDVPIATSGIFDDLGKVKFPEKEFACFNAPAVITPAWDLTRTWINGDRVYSRERYSFHSGATFGLHLILSNYSPEEIPQGVIECKLIDEAGQTVSAIKDQTKEALQRGDVKEIYYLRLKLPETEIPKNFLLSVSLDNKIENHWPIFLYPKPKDCEAQGLFLDTSGAFPNFLNFYKNFSRLEEGIEIPQETSLVVTDRLTPEIQNYLQNGGRVFLNQITEGLFPWKRISFWREGMCQEIPHPITENFKYQGAFNDLRFFGVAPEFSLDSCAAAEKGYNLLSPIVRRFDCREWHCSEYLAEYTKGKGKLIATTFRLAGGLGKETPSLGGNVLGRYLLEKAIEYLSQIKK